MHCQTTMPAILTRREFTQASLALTVGFCGGRGLALGAEREQEDSLRSIEPLGMLVRECSLPGETRADGVVPCHGSGIQVSRDRWLFVYSTHGFRGVDDERSIVYQLRRGARMARSSRRGSWLRDARTGMRWATAAPRPGPARRISNNMDIRSSSVCRRALINGRTPSYANLFVAKWRRVARVLDLRRNYLEHATAHQETRERSQGVEWVQFRLNAAENDIELAQPMKQLRQKGYESGAAFCSREAATRMNQSFVRPVPFNDECSQWADCNHFNNGRLAALKYRYNPQTDLYEWIETGPLVSDERHGLSEASLCRTGAGWLIAARVSGRRGPAWAMCEDPFGRVETIHFADSPASAGPLTVCRCADGVLRLFTGDPTLSPRGNPRDPLYCWDIDLANRFAASDRRIVFDSVEARIPFRAAVVPKVDFCELLPPHGGSQLVCHRVVTRAYDFPYAGGDGKLIGIPALNEEEKLGCGIYAQRLTYTRTTPPMWQFVS